VSAPGEDADNAESLWAKRTLRNGLVWIVVAALLPIAIVSFLQGRAAWRDAEALATTQLRANAWLIAEGERDPFIVARQALQFVSRASAVRNMENGCSDFLADAHLGTTGTVNLTRSDASGRVRCSALPFSPTETFAAQNWWRRAINADGVTLSTPIIGQISKKAILVMAFRMKGADGKQDGLVTASVSLSALRYSLARRGKNNPSALIEIIDGNGGSVISNRNTTLNLTLAMVANAQSSTARSQDGLSWLYATAPLHGKDLTIVYAEPRDDLLATALWQVRQSILLPLIAMALASLAIWMGTHWLVVRWLRKLRRLAEQFGRGDFFGDRAAFNKAPREIAALSDDLHAMAETIDRRTAALDTALAAKTALTREVNHRVKNNLQIVTSLLTLQADRVADTYARDALGQARARIAALGLIHRVLYEHDTHNASGTVNMPILLAALCPQLRAANRGASYVDLRCDCDDFDLSVDQAVPLTLFIVEGVTNAFRHGFGDERTGIIGVTMLNKDGNIDLSIKDDGDGYAVPDPVGKMGFELMNAFAMQLSGTLNVSSDPAGTHIRLSYPRVQY
jgi:two-component sensor histidine kinase